MTKNYKEIARHMRIKVLEMIHRGGTSHIASNFSVIDIAAVLYENLKDGDEIVWSKGWAAATIYYCLAKQGKIPLEDLEKFPNAPYFGLAEVGIPGVHVSGGSMGHGLAVAVGMAIGKKRAGEKGKVYCIMSDGECNEGTTWESAAVAAQHKLDNLVVFVDHNKWQAMGTTEEVLNINLVEAFRGFGWDSGSTPGHDHEAIEEVITDFFDPKCEQYEYEKPHVSICETIKGKGVSFMENHLLYHYKHVDAPDYERALNELNK